MSGYCVQRWSLGLGRWWGVSISLHMFLLFVVLGIALAPTFEHRAMGLVAVGVLLASLLLHELAHAWAALRVGGKVDAIVVGPVGGLVPPRVPDEPEVHLFVALAGPLIHLLLAVLAAVTLAANGDTELTKLLNPFAPVEWLGDSVTWMAAAKLTLWLNWILMLMNLLPSYPFDGGAILRAVLWPALGRRTARVVTSRVAMALAVALCAVGLLSLGAEYVTPIWLPLTTLGIFLFFSAQQDLQIIDPEDAIDEGPGYRAGTAGVDLLDVMWPDDEEEGVLVEHQQPPLERHIREQEEFEDARVDDILARLSDCTMAELSPEEVDVLNRASERYKQRRRASIDR